MQLKNIKNWRIMMSKERKKKEKVVPSFLGWLIYVTFGRIYMAFKNRIIVDRKVFKKRNKKEGCLVIYNHASNKDHFFTTFSFGYTRAAYVVTTHFYFSKKIRTVLKLVKAIPKEQFKADITAIKKIKRALQKRIPVAIAPAGQITVHGDALYIDPAFVKLVRMCNVDVYAIRIHGGYYAYPKWRKYRRKSPIHTEFVKVIDKTELNTLTDDEIYQRTCDSIHICDRTEIEKYHYHLKSKGLIEGIEKVLYQCPKCMSKYQMVAHQDILECLGCHNTIKMNEFGLLEGVGDHYTLIQNETDWYKWEQENIKKTILEENFHLEGRFKLFHNLHSQYELEEVGEGKVVLTQNELYYEGTMDQKPVKKQFKLERLTQLPFEVSSHFDIPDDDGCFEFKPIDSERNCVIIEFVQAVEVLSWIRKMKEND